jgi:hypothetical protein
MNPGRLTHHSRFLGYLSLRLMCIYLRRLGREQTLLLRSISPVALTLWLMEPGGLMAH